MKKIIIIILISIVLAIGVLFYKTELASPSSNEVQKLISLSKLGDPKSERQLADLYFEGRGMDKNPAEAVKLYQDAALKGDGLAEFKLGGMYDHGGFFPKDPQSAYKWTSLSVKNGLNIGKMFANALRSELSQQQIDEADKWVEEWKPDKSSIERINGLK